MATNGQSRLSVDGVVQAHAFFSTSDGRLKDNVQTITDAIKEIKQLRGVSYTWSQEAIEKRNLDAMPQIGFIVQEVEKIIPEAVIKKGDGYYSINYSTVIPILTEGIKEQQTMIEELKLEITELKSKLNQLTSGYNIQLKNTPEYFQIVPNPVEQESKIIYNLENASNKALFAVYDLQGKVLKQINLPINTLKGQLPLNKKDLGKGMYILSLIMNNNEVQSKKFVVL